MPRAKEALERNSRFATISFSDYPMLGRVLSGNESLTLSPAATVIRAPMTER
jgi:hypothetical protein